MTTLDTPLPADLEMIRREIAELTAANVEQRSYQRERRLLELRHEATAFPVIDGAPDWPPPLPDPFPDETGLAEIPADALTTEVMGGALQHHALLLVRGLLPAPHCELLVHCIDKALNRVRNRKNEPNAWYTPFRTDQGRFGFGLGDQTLSVTDSPRSTFHFCQIYEPIVTRFIEPYLGERPVLRSGKWTLRRIPPDIDGHWHQDGRFLGGEMRVVNAWTALTRCGPGTGAPGLEVLPRRVPILDTLEMNGQKTIAIDDALIDSIRGDTPVVSPVYEPGDVLFFDHFTCHRPGLVPGLDTTRYAIESWFFAPSANPYADHEPLFSF